MADMKTSRTVRVTVRVEPWFDGASKVIARASKKFRPHLKDEEKFLRDMAAMLVKHAVTFK